MAKYTLHIDCEDVHELASIANRLAQAPVATVVYKGEIAMPETDAPAAPAVEAAKRGRKPKDGPLSSSRAPDADVSTNTAPTDGIGTADTVTTSGTPAATATPVNSAATPAAPTVTAAVAQTPASDGAAVTYEDLKAALTKLMEKKSAKVAQETLKKSVGFGSLSSTPPDKYGAALAAINAELAT